MKKSKSVAKPILHQSNERKKKWLYLIITFLIQTTSVSSAVLKKEEAFKPHSVAEFYIVSLAGKYVPGVYDGVKEPKQLPDLVENRKTLLGIDSNGNGIRDDVEIYINRNIKHDYDRIMYRQFFRRGTRFLKNAGKLSVSQIQNEIDGFDRDLECTRYLVQFGYIKDLKEVMYDNFNIYGLLFDTKERQSVFEKATRQLRMSSSGIETAEEAYKVCPSSIKTKFPLKRKAK